MFSSSPPLESAPRPALGNSLAAIVGITWATIMVGLRHLARADGPGRDAAPSAVAAGNLLAFLICLPVAAPLLQLSLKNGLILLYLGVFQIAGAYFLLMKGVERVSAFEASLLLLLEPVLSPIWAWSFNGERLSGMTMLGGAIILIASAAQVLRPKKPMPVARVTLAPAIADPLPGVAEESDRIHEANLDEVTDASAEP
jgi:drug/metabolite transporter (DMT)-like permease